MASPRRHAAAALLFGLAAGLSLDAGATQLPVRPADVDPSQCVPGVAPELVPRLLRVVVNHTDTRREYVFLQRPCGALLARRADLTALRIRTEGLATVTIDGESHLNLNEYDGLQFALAEAEQRLTIDGEPHIFYPTVLDLAPAPAPPPRRVLPGAFVNYGLFGATTPERDTRDLSASAGVGVFAGESILLSDWVYYRHAEADVVHRLDTTFVRDDVARMSTLRIGDVATRASAFGGGAAIAGVQYGTNFATRPKLPITPLQVLDATARQTAALGLFVNPQDPQRASRAMFLSGLTTVPHGPVELINVPTYNNGEYELLVRDALGREMLVRQPFFFNAGLLRSGLHDFSYEAGVMREGSGGDDYGGALVSSTHRYGLSNTFTIEGQAAGSAHGGVVGATGLLAVPHLGVLAVTGAGSTSRFADGVGALGALSVENRFARHGYALRLDCQNEAFVPPAAAAPESAPACRAVAALSWSLPAQASVGLSLARVDHRDGEDLLSARIGLTTRPWHGAHLTGFAGWSQAEDDDVSAGLTVSVSLASLGRGIVGRRLSASRRTQLSATVAGDADALTQAEARLSTGAQMGEVALGLHASSTFSGTPREGVTLTGAAPAFNLVAGMQSNDAQETYAAGATGAVAWLGRRWLPTRPLYSSFALVRLGPENAGVRVNGVPADAYGDVLVAPMQAYALNPVAINGADLPMNARVEAPDGVVPRWRSGVVLRPRIERVRDAMLTVHLRDASGTPVPLPVGAWAKVAGNPERFPVGEDGAVYVSGLRAESVVTIRHGDAACQLNVVVPTPVERDAIPEIGPLLCEGVTP